MLIECRGVHLHVPVAEQPGCRVVAGMAGAAARLSHQPVRFLLCGGQGVVSAVLDVEGCVFSGPLHRRGDSTGGNVRWHEVGLH